MTTTQTTQIRFDDLDALKKLVGEEFGPWGNEIQVTQEKINRFADLTEDHQWIHIDIERAKKGPFGGTIAHGFFVLSLIPALRVRTDREITGYGNIVNYGADKLRFVSPVPAGSTVHARSRVVSVEQKPKGVQVTEEIQVGVVGSETPAISYFMLALYQPPRK
jgi:uncharacterized protein